MSLELAERISSKDAFNLEFVELRTAYLKRELKFGDADFDPAKLFRLLQSALHLSHSPDRKHRSLAYQIAISFSKMQNDISPQMKDILGFIFTRLANFPAIDLLYGEVGK